MAAIIAPKRPSRHSVLNVTPQATPACGVFVFKGRLPRAQMLAVNKVYNVNFVYIVCNGSPILP